jgi:hypothetical protein
MASILLRTTYTNPQPYGDRTSSFYGTNYDQTDWIFDTVTRTAAQQSQGVVNDDFDTGQYQDFSYSGEFYNRCVGTTREGYVHDGVGGFTVNEELNSAQCSVLYLDSLTHTDETATDADDGTATIQASGGLGALTASIDALLLTQPATSGVPVTFTGLPVGTHTVKVRDSATPLPAVVQGDVTVLAFTEPVAGCTDEYSDTYDPAATSDTVPTSCTYSPRWRSAWQWMAVHVAAVAGQVEAFIEADLIVGFRPGHPLAAYRPLGNPLRLTATVGPDGYATFRLGPYLRSQLGAPDGRGGYRLDLNSPTAYDADLYVGYELRRTNGAMIEHGYALNSAVPDGQIKYHLGPFGGEAPVWPGFDTFPYAFSTFVPPGLGVVLSDVVTNITDAIYLPCPLNPVPVAWLAPGSGYGYWVFSGKPVLSDTLGDGQSFSEAETGERRWSSRGEARKVITANSGVFKGEKLMQGLRSLWRSPQVWYQPVLDGPWVPVTIEPGSFPAGRLGVPKQNFTIEFSESAAQYQQGQ